MKSLISSYQKTLPWWFCCATRIETTSWDPASSQQFQFPNTLSVPLSLHILSPRTHLSSDLLLLMAGPQTETLYNEYLFIYKCRQAGRWASLAAWREIGKCVKREQKWPGLEPPFCQTLSVLGTLLKHTEGWVRYLLNIESTICYIVSVVIKFDRICTFHKIGTGRQLC